jgi:predicted metal-dependent peptidase
MPKNRRILVNAYLRRLPHLDVTGIKNDIRDVRIFCGRYFPFVVIPLSYARIIASEQAPTAGVDEKGRIIVNPEWWSNLDVASKRYAMIHECLHVVLCHPFRMKGFNRVAYNISADGKVNYAITEANVSGVEFKQDGLVTLNSLATITRLRVEDLEKMSTEEIVRVLESCGNASGSEKDQAGSQDSFGDDLLNGEAEGEIIQGGDNSVNSPKTEEDLKQAWKQLCEKAKAFAKQAGTMPASLERIVDEILEVKPPWQVTVRFGLRNSSTFDSSFAYPNRRNDDLPGPLDYEHTVWLLIDTSGSVTEDELQCFLGIAKYESRNASLRVLAWDAQTYEILKAERPREVASKIASKMKGGGGTVCLPVLQRVHKLMNTGDAVIMLSDMEISDWNDKEAQSFLNMIEKKAGFAMIASSYRQPSIIPSGWRFASLGAEEVRRKIR